jgi:hypothetical protein
VEISVGSYVQWWGGRGRVDLLVTKGSIPGVPLGSHPPAARIRVWERHGGTWSPTGRRVAVPLGDLDVVPPPLPDADGADRLVALLAAHQEYVTTAGLPATARPTGHAIKQVYLRGMNSWPGPDATALRQQEWALQRVHAFLTVAAGSDLDGYLRDLDLLPEGHPSSTRPSRPRASLQDTR